MRYRLVGTILPTLAIVLLTTCDNVFSTYDQTWFVEYVVSNQSSTAVTVRYGSNWLIPRCPVHVPSGARKRLVYYEEFLGPPPDANRSFSCVSVYRDDDSLLVFQIAPVSNSQWKRVEHRKYHEQYTLELTDAKLSAQGVRSRCGELSGSVVDSLTGVPMDTYHVRFHSDSGSFEENIETWGCHTGNYLLIWYGDVPGGRVYFSAPGYQCRKFTFAVDADSVAFRRYRVDAEMVRMPLPEDSLRWGSCVFAP